MCLVTFYRALNDISSFLPGAPPPAHLTHDIHTITDRCTVFYKNQLISVLNISPIFSLYVLDFVPELEYENIFAKHNVLKNSILRYESQG